MYNLMDVDIPLVGAFYGILTRIFFAYILFNLLLAIIISNFIGYQQEQKEAELTETVDEHRKQYDKELEHYH
jgi:hypothetical protein